MFASFCNDSLVVILHLVVMMLHLFLPVFYLLCFCTYFAPLLVFLAFFVGLRTSTVVLCLFGCLKLMFLTQEVGVILVKVIQPEEIRVHHV